MNLIETLEKELGKPSLPPVGVGDTVEVHYLIREGDKERVQLFVGTVISLKGRGIRKTVTVRRIVQGEGVERIFPIHSPRVQDVIVKKKGNVRRAKLHYLRDRVGRATRIEERVGAMEKHLAAEAKIKAAEEAAAPKPEAPKKEEPAAPKA
jgi:large subunit ribosomal protein L19